MIADDPGRIFLRRVRRHGARGPCTRVGSARRSSSPRVLLDLAAVPVRLPGHRLAVPQRSDHDHLALETCPSCSEPGRGLDEQRPQQHRPLRIERLAVGSAELVPDLELGSRYLVTVVGLRREEVRVVDLHRVARRELRRDGGSAKPSTTTLPAMRATGSFLPSAAPLSTMRSPPRKSTGGAVPASRNATIRCASSPCGT